MASPRGCGLVGGAVGWPPGASCREGDWAGPSCHPWGSAPSTASKAGQNGEHVEGGKGILVEIPASGYHAFSTAVVLIWSGLGTHIFHGHYVATHLFK